MRLTIGLLKRLSKLSPTAGMMIYSALETKAPLTTPSMGLTIYD
jgi:hypothetical protein